MKRTVVSIAMAATLTLGVYSTSAQAAWPSDMPIQVIVGFAPGGTTDVMARMIAPYIAKHLGDSARLAVINRPGAGGEIAANAIMRAAPDGYTIGVVNLPGYFFLPMHRKTSYTVNDLTLIGRVVSDPTIMVTRRDGPLVDMETVLKQLRADPRSLSAGHNGIGTNGHIAIAGLSTAANVEFNDIPYSGNAQQKTALGGNQLDIGFQSASEMLDPEKEAVPMRILAQFTQDKVKHLGSVPTTHELGFAVDMTAERGFAAPNDLPEDVLTRLRKAIKDAINDPEYVKAATKDAPFLSYLDGETWMQQVQRDIKAYEGLAKTLPQN